ncbi:homodimeric glycerol 3-phosphate dehydrogenase (quinone) [Alkalibacterium putridalgicola]|uniref:Alpha-glycerophosphate oxidase n=1 Tax=Alkalibacterium putridalgicola TaxID=426703 RepID=A0A1H7U4H2_9LACT|nr:FAD-dependent oxidoreductase [Alkalibacterium putridalgicola]GEK90352.1 glycerol-3-phosphate dehydrogenase [Alkalibacterium putridalgicola]SEL91606.1 homodimeric glycerol 3-phosphate dehydrogenase (quinone) [Alkalibacterium putridalgicola]
MTFSAQTRKSTIEQLKKQTLDLLIIGGGVTGAGLALQGAVRGSRVGLVEMQDFGGGTSSRSTKLVHGGLRYLKQFEVELVADVAKERAVIARNAPHIVQPDFMLMPVYDEPGASFNAFSAEVVLHLYDYLAEVDETWQHYLAEKTEVLEDEPSLKEENLLAGGYYLDYINDDCRLTIETVKKAHELGAWLANYVKAVGFIYDDKGQIKGVKARDTLSDEYFDIKATVVVNATGPWSDELRKKQRDVTEKKMYPTKGVHFVVDHEKLPVTRAIYTDTGLNDDRMIFVVPRGNKTYFGTTDTPFNGPYEDPEITQEDIEYLLNAVNHRFDVADLSLSDIVSSWAGLRPLIKDEDNSDPSGISRGHEVFLSEDGLITIAGGKLTDYRGMAEDTFTLIDQEWKTAGISFPDKDTKEIPLSGGDIRGTMADFVSAKRSRGMSLGLDEAEADYLADWYGSNIDKVYDLVDKAETMDMPLPDALQLAYGLAYEMVMTPEDFFGRRTDSLLFNIDKLESLTEPVLTVLETELGWNRQERADWSSHLGEQVVRKKLTQFKSNGK